MSDASPSWRQPYLCVGGFTTKDCPPHHEQIHHCLGVTNDECLIHVVSYVLLLVLLFVK